MRDGLESILLEESQGEGKREREGRRLGEGE